MKHWRIFIAIGNWFCITGILCHWETRPDNGLAYLFEEEKLTWSEADKQCKNLGGTLATARSKEEETFIVKNLHKHIGCYYIGGKKSFSGEWTWTDVSLISAPTFWGRGEPNNSGGKENCLEFKMYDGIFRWNDISCDNLNGYVCQYNACLSSPCMNNGTCTPLGLAYECECELTFSNKLSCDIDCSPGPADVVFVVDTSSSLENKTNKCLEYMSRILDRLPLSNDGFQVAIISYDFEPKELITLGQYQNAGKIKEVFTGIHYKTQGSTYTGNALRKSFQILTDENTKEKAHKFIIIMSDGLSADRYDAIKEAERFILWPHHVIITIGIGEQIDHFELIKLASRDQHGIYGPLVFSSSNDDAMNMIIKKAMHKDCANCSISNSTDVIIIQDNNLSGDVFQYSLSVATEIANKYFLTKKDVRLGRISFDVNDFEYYSLDVQFLAIIQKLNHMENSESNIESLVSDAVVQLLACGLERNKVIVIITDGRWSNITRIEEKMKDLSRQNITVMTVAVTKNSNFTTLYRVAQDPFFVFYINNKNRWNVIDVIVSQSFRVICK